MKVLITGAAGFIGGYLAKHCAEAGASVLGIDIREPEHAWPHDAFERCDVSGLRALASFALHISSRAYLPSRGAELLHAVLETAARDASNINVGGTVSLFESLRALAMKPLVAVACSSAEYGSVAEPDLPIRESHALCPLHPYGVSKVAAGLARRAIFHELCDPGDSTSHFQYHWTGKTGRCLLRPHEARHRDRDGNLSAVTCGRQPAKSPLTNRCARSGARSLASCRTLLCRRGLQHRWR